MASWEDGPEYAPLERPAEFDPADTAPLDEAPPFEQPAENAPQERPQFSGPAESVAPLATLDPAATDQHRDPNRPFDVVTSTITADPSAGPSAWGSVHGGSGGGPGGGSGNGSGGGSGGGAAGPGWGPPTGMPVAPPFGDPGSFGAPPTQPNLPNWPAPTDPMNLSAGPATGQNGFPAPGTNGWFGYESSQPPSEAPPPDAKALAQAVTPPVIIFLLLAFIYPLAPITFVIAWVLSSRITVARRAVLRSFGAALAAIVLFFLIFLAASDGTTGAYTIFSRCVFFFSWAELVVVGLLVWRGLKRQPPQPPYGDNGYPPLRSPWG